MHKDYLKKMQGTENSIQLGTFSDHGQKQFPSEQQNPY